MAPERIIIERSTPADHFTIIPNALIRDGKLSRFARSCLIEILSNDDSWRNTADDMWRRGQANGRRGEGRAVYRKAFTEMETAGYLTRSKMQDPNGTWYTVLHFRATATPTDQKLVVGTTSNNTATAQVAPTYQKPVVGSPVVGSPVVIREVPLRRNSKEGLSDAGSSGDEQGRSPDGAQPDGRAAHEGRILCDVRAAMSRVYGEADSQDLADEEVLGLWETCKPQDGRKVRSRIAYMSKIFEDTPDIGTLLAKFQDAAGNPYDEPPAGEVYDGSRHCPTCYADGYGPIHAQVSGFCVWHEETHGLAGKQVG